MPKPTMRKDGRWTLALPRQAGKPRRYVYGRSPAECLDRYHAAIGAGTVRVRPGSVAEFVAVHFQPWVEGRVSADTLARYDTDWRTVIAPAVGHLRWDELTAPIVERAILGSGKGPSSQRGAKSILSQIVRIAIAHELTDPSRLVMVSIVRVEGARRKERFDARARADRMIEAAQSLGHWTEGFIFAAMTLGLRKGELCGLKRSDIDEGRGVLTVSRQRNHTMGERDRLKHRTEGQTRVIGLPSAILGRLLGYCRPGAIYLVTRPDGSPPPTNHFDRYLEPVEERAGVRMTPHDFRSAAISALVDAGVDDRAIMDLVGHSSRAMIDWYRDNRPDRTRDALARIVDA